MTRLRAVLASLVFLLGACALPPASPAVAPLELIDGLARPVVADRDPGRPAYNRDDWQPHGWEDADHDGCNTRAEVLKAESSATTTTKTTNCTVLTGRWHDPYTGRDVTEAAQLQVDHLVALGDAAASGGWAWSSARKVAFANNLEDEWALNAVWGPENERKADYGPDRWLPPSAAFRCTYVASYARVKAAWGLTVTPAQWAAITAVWAGC